MVLLGIVVGVFVVVPKLMVVVLNNSNSRVVLTVG